MQQLQFVDLDEDGRLVVLAEDGTRYAVPVDDRLRAALRPRPVTPAFPGAGAPAVSPRDVQAMIRAGQTPDEVSAASGWEVERVRRFEGPVLAEREHVVGLAQRAHVRAQGRTDGSHTLGRRVRERLQTRDVDLATIAWDATRSTPQGPWTVLVIFTAGGKERRAAWHYKVQDRSIQALDDEARWLSEDEQALPGGLAAHPMLGSGHGEDEAAADLMATMRERRQQRSRRTRREASTSDPAHVPGRQGMPEEVLPLEDLRYDPDTMGDPPAAHPGGSAPEAAAPVGTEPDETDDETGRPAPAAAGTPQPGPELKTEREKAKPASRRQPRSGEQAPKARTRSASKRRRLRMPKLPAAVDAPVEQDKEQDKEPDGSFARTRHDPNEVSLEEFFGTEELEDDYDELDEHYHGMADEEFDTEPGAGEPADEPGSVAPVAVKPADEPGDAGPGAGEPAEPLASDASDAAASDAAATEGTDAGAQSPAAGSTPQPESQPVETQPVETQPVASRPAGRKARTSVPSWDDIMFGSRDRRG